MRRVAVDANVLYGGLVRRDQHHDDASELLSAFDHGSLPRGVVVSSVLEEAVNLLHVDTSQRTALRLLDALGASDGFETTDTTRYSQSAV